MSRWYLRSWWVVDMQKLNCGRSFSLAWVGLARRIVITFIFPPATTTAKTSFWNECLSSWLSLNCHNEPLHYPAMRSYSILQIGCRSCLLLIVGWIIAGSRWSSSKLSRSFTLTVHWTFNVCNHGHPKGLISKMAPRNHSYNCSVHLVSCEVFFGFQREEWVLVFSTQTCL